MMRILEQAVLSDGTLIRLEDWNVDFGFLPFGSTIAAYPKKYIRMRAAADFTTHADAAATFNRLVEGTATITDVNFTVMKSGGTRVPLKPILEKYRRIIDEGEE